MSRKSLEHSNSKYLMNTTGPRPICEIYMASKYYTNQKIKKKNANSFPEGIEKEKDGVELKK